MICAWPPCQNITPLHQKSQEPCIYCSKTCTSKASQVRRRKELKQLAVAYKGGCCELCGYHRSLRALQFHHRVPGDKAFNISRVKAMAWEKLKIELDKCVLLCANCHAEMHDTMSDFADDLGY